MTYTPSGLQYVITSGLQRATVVEVGGGIREYKVGERDVLEPYALDQMCDGAHGAPLIPWPNRLAEGRYSFGGSDHQVALTEPDKDNAIHGFLRWRPWHPIEHQQDRVTMAATLLPLQGYPFALNLSIAYQIDHNGLTVTTSATNIGDRPAPYGCGQHPYLSPGPGLIDDCTLQLGADTRILTDPARKLPTGTESIKGTAYDFREPTKLGDLELDCAFTDLHRDAEDRAWVRLTGTDDHAVQLWVDTNYHLLEVYTGDQLAPDRRRRGLGAEPMTCPPNAFQTGERVIVLDPGPVLTRPGERG